MNVIDQGPNDTEAEPPGGIRWLFAQIGWFLRRYVAWPIADATRAIGRGLGSCLGWFQHRSPLAYIGGTLAVTITAGAVAAAIYFENKAESGPATPVIAQPAAQPESAYSQPATTPDPVTTAQQTGDPALQGVAPNFQSGTTAGKSKAARKAQLEKTLVKPSPAPDSGPLKVAHSFAKTFAGYEVGDRKAARRLSQTAIPRLTRELRDNPPRLPANGKVPKAVVLNVVKGKRTKNRMDVSVSLMRVGATSELRLGLTRSKGSGWKVSEVKS